MVLAPRPRAVVTGGGDGLGRAFCLRLAELGARTLVADIDEEGAERTAKDVRLLGGEATAVACDVSVPDQVGLLRTIADDRFGGVDLLINNAGVSVSGATGYVPLEGWKWVMGVNLWGVIHGCHVFAEAFKAQRSGHILNVASAAGLFAAPQLGPYNVTKAGVVSLSETLSVELRSYGVGVTVLCPTYFQSRILERGRGYGDGNGGGPALEAFARYCMKRAKLTASDVAARALQSCQRDELYAIPMTDGRVLWGLKRLLPGLYHRHIASRLVPSVHVGDTSPGK